MPPYDRHLQAAVGFLELGMPLDANEEVEAIEPEMKMLPEVLAVRIEIFRALAKWELMEVVARQLVFQQPDEPQSFISLAFATRRAIEVQEALDDALIGSAAAFAATVSDRQKTLDELTQRGFLHLSVHFLQAAEPLLHAPPGDLTITSAKTTLAADTAQLLAGVVAA